jgi:hypothetical protein
MTGISGLGDFSKDLRKLGERVEKLNGHSVSIEPTDSITDVVEKLKRDIRRKGAYEPSASELRDVAQVMANEARRQA